jgi:inosine/xanthosine triphosphate pyrophosphatase family protein
MYGGKFYVEKSNMTKMVTRRVVVKKKKNYQKILKIGRKLVEKTGKFHCVIIFEEPTWYFKNRTNYVFLKKEQFYGLFIYGRKFWSEKTN